MYMYIIEWNYTDFAAININCSIKVSWGFKHDASRMKVVNAGLDFALDL